MDVVRSSSGDFVVLDQRGFTPSEWAEIRSESFGVNVISMPDRSSDLSYLAPAFSWLRYLRVNSATCNDLSLVSQMPNLKALAVGGVVKTGASAALLPALESFGGPHEKFPGIENLASLRTLGVRWRSDRAPLITAPIETLEVTEQAASSEVPRLKSPQSLLALGINFARGLSLVGLDDCSNLESLTLHRCRHVSDARVLLELPKLKSLVLEACGDITGYEELVALRGVTVRVIGVNPFGEQFRAEATASQWLFPSGARFMGVGF